MPLAALLLRDLVAAAIEERPCTQAWLASPALDWVLLVSDAIVFGAPVSGIRVVLLALL